MASSRTEFVLVVGLAMLCSCLAIKVEYDANALIIDGQRKVIISGSIHYPRSTPEVSQIKISY